MSPRPPEEVQKLQAALHARAKGSPTWVNWRRPTGSWTSTPGIGSVGGCVRSPRSRIRGFYASRTNTLTGCWGW